MISEQWKEMGWQGKDPSTDFRYQPVNPLPSCSLRFYVPDAVSILLAGEAVSYPWRICCILLGISKYVRCFPQLAFKIDL